MLRIAFLKMLRLLLEERRLLRENTVERKDRLRRDVRRLLEDLRLLDENTNILLRNDRRLPLEDRRLLDARRLQKRGTGSLGVESKGKVH